MKMLALGALPVNISTLTRDVQNTPLLAIGLAGSRAYLE